jgi:hypothetical protein
MTERRPRAYFEYIIVFFKSLCATAASKRVCLGARRRRRSEGGGVSGWESEREIQRDGLLATIVA